MSNMAPTLGQIMKKARLDQRFTQEEIAERIGCHPQYYKNLENDKTNQHNGNGGQDA